MITIELVGGPADGMEIRTLSHQGKWMVSRPTYVPLAPMDGEVKMEPLRIAVYERVPGTDKYSFRGIDRW
jgi:hypothetical protein